MQNTLASILCSITLSLHDCLQTPAHTQDQFLDDLCFHARKPSTLQLQFIIIKAYYFQLIHFMLQDCPSIFNWRQIRRLCRPRMEDSDAFVAKVRGSLGSSVSRGSILLENWVPNIGAHQVLKSWKQAILKQSSIPWCCH